jgi:hypothetical protein
LALQDYAALPITADNTKRMNGTIKTSGSAWETSSAISQMTAPMEPT